MKRTPLKRGSKQMKRTPLARKTTLATKKRATGQISGNKGKEKTQAQLKKELDQIFSIFIRQKYSDGNGMVACYTCGKVMHWKQIQNGHFISRSYLATRFHEDNCRPQCIGDNIFGNGKPLDFEEHLKRDLGDEYVENLKKLRHTTVKYDRQWYIAQIEKYKLLIHER